MIIKSLKPDLPFTCVPNATLNDHDLKPEDLGVLVYLISKPEDWQVRSTELCARFGIGRNRLYSILQRLQAAGYATYERAVSGKTTWTIAAEPLQDVAGRSKSLKDNLIPKTGMSPHPQKPDEEKPDEAFRDVLQKKETSQKNKNQKKKIDGWIDQLKGIYPRRQGADPRQRAVNALNARMKDGHKFDVIFAGAKKYSEYCKATNVEPRYVMQLATFLGPDLHFENEWQFDKKQSIASMREEDIEAAIAANTLPDARPGESWDQYRHRISQ